MYSLFFFSRFYSCLILMNPIGTNFALLKHSKMKKKCVTKLFQIIFLGQIFFVNLNKNSVHFPLHRYAAMVAASGSLDQKALIPLHEAYLRVTEGEYAMAVQLLQGANAEHPNNAVVSIFLFLFCICSPALLLLENQLIHTFSSYRAS